MPGKVKVKIVSGRHLPVMDRSSETTDAFAEVKLGDTTYKTDVCRKSLNPSWNSEWFRFDVDDLDLQDEPLQIRIMDYDTYSANDAIGKVYIGLNPLLIARGGDLANSNDEGDVAPTPEGNFMSGWLPIFDTMHGVRGEVNVQVKVELFSDRNKFRQSSCGVPFFFTSGVPFGYKAQHVNGFVEELVVNDDPEYQWIDKIRTPRASNEARQTLFMKLSGAVQRKIGLKALALGGNAVVGYQQKFDMEGDTGIVVRGIGTAVTLVKSPNGSSLPPREPPSNPNEPKEPEGGHASAATKTVPSSALAGDANASSSSAIPVWPTHNHIFPDSETAGHSPKDASAAAAANIPKAASGVKLQQEAHDLLEYPFVTMKRFPPDLIRRFGGLVSCRSVKLLEGPEEEDVRDVWWTEIRREVRSHAKALGCNLIVGYTEDAVISEDVVVLCASGTAALGNLNQVLDLESVGIFGPPLIPNSGCGRAPAEKAAPPPSSPPPPCSVFHLPYSDISLPYAFRVGRCRCCRKGKVPDVVFTTVEPPDGMELVGRGCLIQAKVLRLKKDLKGDNNAKEISYGLPFVEYEIHRQLINKLKVKGMNALFGLKAKLSISDRTIVATATATAAYVRALPPPSRPKLVMATASEIDRQRLRLMQRRLEEKVAENEAYYGLAGGGGGDDDQDEDAPEPDDPFEGPEADLSTGNKDTSVLEIDDTEDADIVDSLMDQFPPSSVQVFSTEELIGVAPEHIVKCCQTFSQIWRGRIQPTSGDLSSACKKLLASLYFKLRRLRPCIISSLDFKADLNEENELQLSATGTAIALAHGGKTKAQMAGEGSDADVSTPPARIQRGRTGFYVEMVQAQVIHITPLSYVPGAKVEKYLGNLNVFLIRETSSLREAGGLCSFVQSFVSEIYSIVRCHVSALGGNSLVSYFVSELVVKHSFHKNQAQCLIHVGGDAVKVMYVPCLL